MTQSPSRGHRPSVQAYVEVRQRVVERGLPPELSAAEDPSRAAAMSLEGKARTCAPQVDVLHRLQMETVLAVLGLQAP